MIQQGSEEWLQSRLGKVTASRIADVIAKTKTGVSASRGNYMAELIAERLTGKQAPNFSNASMAWGTECEPLARAAYEADTGCLVAECGLVDHPSIGMTGASPDGLVGNDGLLEIKCPETKAHIETLIAKKAPSKYIPQMMWQMACTGCKWCDFVSFDPRMPEHLQLFKTRVERDEKMIKEIEAEVIGFIAEIETTIEKLEN